MLGRSNWSVFINNLKNESNQYLVDFHLFFGELVGDRELQDDFLVVIGFQDLSKFVGKVEGVQFRCGCLKNMSFQGVIAFDTS